MAEQEPPPGSGGRGNERDPVAEALDTLAAAVERYRPVKVFALFSGGHDSLCSAHVASRAARFDGCVHIDTGIGVPETREFVRATCRRHGWPLAEYRPPVGYEEIVLRWGFLGPVGHGLMYARLKERCLRQLTREHKTRRADTVLLVTGIRRHESRRRMGYTAAVRKDGARVWAVPAAPLDPRRQERLPRRPRPRPEPGGRLYMSGECLCVAFARRGSWTRSPSGIPRWRPESGVWRRRLTLPGCRAGGGPAWVTRGAAGGAPVRAMLVVRGQA